MTLKSLNSQRQFLDWRGGSGYVLDGPYADDSSSGGGNRGNEGNQYPLTPEPQTVTDVIRSLLGRSLRFGDTLSALVEQNVAGSTTFTGGGFRMSCYVRINRSTQAAARFVSWSDSPAVVGALDIGVICDGALAGRLYLANGNIAEYPTDPVSGSDCWLALSGASHLFTFSEWHKLSIEYLDPQAGVSNPPARDIEIRGWLDDVPIISYTIVGSTNTVPATMGRWLFRTYFVDAVSNLRLTTHYPNLVFFTDLMSVDLGGTTNTVPPAAYEIACIRPSGAGAYSDSTIGGSAPAATRHASVSELLADDGVTLVSFGTLAHHDSYVFSVPSHIASHAPMAVQVVVRARKVGSGAAAIKVLHKDGASEFLSGAQTLTTAWTKFRFALDRNELTALAWAAGDIDGTTEFGVEVSTLGASTTVEVSQVAVEVVSTPDPGNSRIISRSFLLLPGPTT